MKISWVVAPFIHYRENKIRINTVHFGAITLRRLSINFWNFTNWMTSFAQHKIWISLVSVLFVHFLFSIYNVLSPFNRRRQRITNNNYNDQRLSLPVRFTHNVSLASSATHWSTTAVGYGRNTSRMSGTNWFIQSDRSFWMNPREIRFGFVAVEMKRSLLFCNK